MIIGYARTSTTDQTAGLDAQRRDLIAAGSERIFSEQVSSVASTRPALDECLAFARSGDTVVATKPDRLARSTADLLRLVDDLHARDIGLVVLSMGGQRMDTRSPTSRLTLTLLAAVAEWERSIMLERQKEGIAAAVAAKDGRYKGRKPTARAKADQIIALDEAGHTRAEIARQAGVGIASVYRVLRDHERG